MSIYSDKLANVQVIINCQYFEKQNLILTQNLIKVDNQIIPLRHKRNNYSGAQMCTLEDMLAHYISTPSIDDVMRHNTVIKI